MRLGGLVFTRQFPNSVEPFRGTFVVQQVACTRDSVDWSVVAPVPYAPRALATVEPRAGVRQYESLDGVPVWHPRYAVLPRRALFTTVWRSMAASSRRLFSRLVRERRIDVVHAHELYPSGRAALELAREQGVPLVVTVHGSDLYSNLAEPSWRQLVRETVTGADSVICVSSSLADELASTLGVERSALLVVPDTYDAGRFALVPRDERPDGPVRLLSVGRLVDVKGFDVLLGALARLTASGHRTELRIVGDGPLRAPLAARSEELGLGERVVFTGAVGADRLAEEMARADLYVQASRQEGFGVALVEALATGLPVVATASGGPSDIVGEQDGELCAPADPVALEEALARAIGGLGGFDRTLIAERARQRFGPDAVGPRLVDVYQRLSTSGHAGGVAGS